MTQELCYVEFNKNLNSTENFQLNQPINQFIFFNFI
jgi:hypothetical protein